MSVRHLHIYEIPLPLGEVAYRRPVIVISPQFILDEYEKENIPVERAPVVIVPCSASKSLEGETDKVFRMDPKQHPETGLRDITYAIPQWTMMVRTSDLLSGREWGRLSGQLREDFRKFVDGFFFTG